MTTVTKQRLDELAWEAVDGNTGEDDPLTVLVSVDAAEVQWLLEQFPRGRSALDKARRDQSLEDQDIPTISTAEES